MSRSGFSALDPCVHCGFCLPACPTYLATGDENDSPRGRIVLMRALERGELPATDPALREHLDRCLGCRGCEPVCPAGVGYGDGLAAARELLVGANGLPARARFLLGVFRWKAAWRPILSGARWFRDSGLPGRLAGKGGLGFALGMLAASRNRPLRPRPPAGPAGNGSGSRSLPRERETVALFRGCVMDTLFRRVNQATRRTLAANGYRMVEVAGQTCCGALHEHAGDREPAESLLTRNAAAFAGRADFIAVNSAGCGAHLRAAGPDPSRAGLAARVRDVTELLAAAGPRPGAPLPFEAVYDAPCHLEHAQGIRDAPLQVLAAIPGLRVRRLPGSSHCCGSAGIYSILQGAMAREVTERKIAEIAEARPRPELVITGNPGCLMQIGAGLRAAALPIPAIHPVELLDLSYRQAGFYSD